MYSSIQQHLAKELETIRESGFYKSERIIVSPQDAHIRVGDGPSVLNMCANNYLGLAEHPAVIEAAHKGLDRWGYGLSSVRFICGTQSIHRELEAKISEFLGTEDTILYTSCFDANGGLFETLLTGEDAVISDELNHASIIDGIRLCKAGRFRFRNRDMRDLEAQLKEAQSARFRMIATDGVFSMDGCIADLPAICDLADRYDALVMVDDSHAVGFMGSRGRGIHEYHNVIDRVDIITGTLGKALGGRTKTRRVKVADSHDLLTHEESDKLLDDIGKRFLANVFARDGFECLVAELNRPVRMIDAYDDKRLGCRLDNLFQNFAINCFQASSSNGGRSIQRATAVLACCHSSPASNDSRRICPVPCSLARRTSDKGFE